LGREWGFPRAGGGAVAAGAAQTVHVGSIADVAYSSDGRCFASASFDGNVRVYDGRLSSMAS
jgi:WD40 repeat protein